MTSYAYLSDGHPSAGGLSPVEAAHETLETGNHHLTETVELAFLKNIYGGLLISAGGTLSLILANGFPGISETNPGFTRLVQGLTFPIGLVIVYFVGAELYTGYPMWLSMTALNRRGNPMQYLVATICPLLGNLVGALFWAVVQTWFTETVTEEPWRSQIISEIDSDITDQQWHVIFLRSIGCGFLVTIAMILGTQNRDGISKAVGLHLPFFISVAAKFPHTVEYMYLGSVALLLGSRMTIWMFVWKCLLPIILGNVVGGAFTGVVNWWIYIKRADDKTGSSNEGRRNWLPVENDDE